MSIDAVSSIDIITGLAPLIPNKLQNLMLALSFDLKIFVKLLFGYHISFCYCNFVFLIFNILTS